MAQISWRFQDEVVDVPNRYIATNVETGEQVTFDLLRGGKVSVVGTPLNAEKLNSLITAINEKQERAKASSLTFTEGISKGEYTFKTNIKVVTNDWAGLYYVYSPAYGTFFIYVEITNPGNAVSSILIGNVEKDIPAGTTINHGINSSKVIRMLETSL